MSIKKLSLSEAASIMARSGGSATLKKHGKKHYKAMAIKRWAKKPAKVKNK